MIQSKLVSDSLHLQFQTARRAVYSVFDEHAVTTLASLPVSKKAKLFDFINPRLRGKNTIDKLSHADVKQHYAAFIAVADEELCGRGLHIFNEEQFHAPSSSDLYGTSKLCIKLACFHFSACDPHVHDSAELMYPSWSDIGYYNNRLTRP